MGCGAQNNTCVESSLTSDGTVHYMLDSTDFGEVKESATCGNGAMSSPELAEEGTGNNSNNMPGDAAFDITINESYESRTDGTAPTTS